MPVAAKDRVEALVADLGGRAEVARTIGVNRAQVTRWLESGQGPDGDNVRKVEAFELALARLLRLYTRETALRWLQGANPHLGDRRPADLLMKGRISEVLGAIDADESGAYA